MPRGAGEKEPLLQGSKASTSPPARNHLSINNREDDMMTIATTASSGMRASASKSDIGLSRGEVMRHRSLGARPEGLAKFRKERVPSNDALSSSSSAADKLALLPLGSEIGMRRRSNSVWRRLRNRLKPKKEAPHRAIFHKQMVYESLDYEVTESVMEMKEKAGKTEFDYKLDEVYRWGLLFLIGILTACCAFGIDMGIKFISGHKFKIIQRSIVQCVRDDCLVESYLIWVGLDIVLVGIAGAFVCYYAPIAAGSGIPEVKCYLNGIKMPEVVRLKTLLVKAFGVMLAVSGGMAVGKEGPMIHSGAVVAAGLSQGKSTTLSFLNADTKLFKQFRNDVEKRDFVSGGAAAGVSAAFGAPIGGVLFSLEEGASFWNQFLTWRIFFCSMTSTFFLNILLSSFVDGAPGSLSNPGLLNFGKFVDMPYQFIEILIFIAMGCVGGLLGALFNHINERLSHFRLKYIKNPTAKLLEVVTLSMVTCSVAFFLIYFSSDCLPLGESPESSSPLQFFCDEHQYSAMGALLFNTPEDSIKNLFHSPTSAYNEATLIIFSIAYFFLACVTYGLAIPSGLFVPCILTGASWGRFVGTLISPLFSSQLATMAGKYALIGAAAQLGGVVRMTISLTVIIIEATGNITYGLPIMLALIFAKLIGDYFNEGLYDIHIEIKHIPLLPWSPPSVAAARLKASDFMTRDIQCLRMINKVGDLYRMLNNTKHNAFPVVAWGADSSVENEGLAVVQGMMLRHHIIALLHLRAFGQKEGYSVHAPLVTSEQIQSFYPRWPKIESVVLDPADFDMYMDFQPYMNSSPFLALERSSLSKVFNIFRTMGLRHLVVVNKMNQLVGLVTRKDLANINNDMTKDDFIATRDLSRKVKYIMPENVGVSEDACLQRDVEQLDSFSHVQDPLVFYTIQRGATVE